ncbi:MAG: hypothetical protein AAGJ52_02115 [Pseudomonadota bacterium]
MNATSFYAYLPEAALPITTTVAIYGSDANRLPLSAPIATAQVVVSNEGGGGTLNELRQTSVFQSPITISGPFVFAVENQSPASLSLVSNDYLSTDGQGEFLSSVDTADSWLSGEVVNVGGVAFDAEWLIEPIVTLVL